MWYWYDTTGMLKQNAVKLETTHSVRRVTEKDAKLLELQMRQSELEKYVEEYESIGAQIMTLISE